MHALKISSVRAIAVRYLPRTIAPGVIVVMNSRSMLASFRSSESRTPEYSGTKPMHVINSMTSRTMKTPRPPLTLVSAIGRKHQVAADDGQIDQQEQHQDGDHPAALHGLAKLLDRHGIHPIARGRMPTPTVFSLDFSLRHGHEHVFEVHLPLAEVDDAKSLADQVGQDVAVDLVAAVDPDFHLLADHAGLLDRGHLQQLLVQRARDRRRRG